MAIIETKKFWKPAQGAGGTQMENQIMKTNAKSSLMAVITLTGILLTGCESKPMEIKSASPSTKTIEVDSSIFNVMEKGITDYKIKHATAKNKDTEGLLKEPQFICGSLEIPKKLIDLNQVQIYVSNISLNVNASLQAYGFSGSMGKKDVVIVAYFTKFKDYTCDGDTKRAQVGLKLYVHAYELKVKVASPSLGIIAAATELGLAKAEYRFETFGINPDNFYTNLPSAQFTVDTYSKVISSYDNIIHSLDGSTAIDPIITSVPKVQ